MADQEQDVSRSFWNGALLGALIGAVVAIWRAPRSGKQLREQLQGRRKEFISEVEQTAAQVRRQIEGERPDDVIAAAKAEARRLNEMTEVVRR